MFRLSRIIKSFRENDHNAPEKQKSPPNSKLLESGLVKILYYTHDVHMKAQKLTQLINIFSRKKSIR